MMKWFFVSFFAVVMIMMLPVDVFSQTPPEVVVLQDLVQVDHALYVAVIDESQKSGDIIDLEDIPIDSSIPDLAALRSEPNLCDNFVTVKIESKDSLGLVYDKEDTFELYEQVLVDPNNTGFGICDGFFSRQIMVTDDSGSSFNDDTLQVKSTHPLIEVTYGSSPNEITDSTNVNFFDGAVPQGLLFDFQESDNVPCPDLPPTGPAGDDTDNDGVCDAWEKTSVLEISDNGDTYSYNCFETHFPEGCDTDKKDIFVEIDWMAGHQPEPEVIQMIVDEFYRNGIRLHVQVDSNAAIAHDPDIPFPGQDPTSRFDVHLAGFEQIKGGEFGTFEERSSDPLGWHFDIRRLKYQVFHYGLFIHGLGDGTTPNESTGIGEVHGNDFVVALGSLSGKVASPLEQAGTLMHELGHNFGLHHGGALDSPQCKPNHFSVMSYSRQVGIYDPYWLPNYSDDALHNTDSINHLNENSLIESPTGMTLYNGHDKERIIYSCQGGISTIHVTANGGPVDWDCVSAGSPSDENINEFFGCPATGMDASLDGHDDWAALDLNFRDDSNYYAGSYTVAGGFGTIPSGPHIDYFDVVDREMTQKDITSQRIDMLIALYRDLYAISPEKFQHEIGQFTESFAQESDKPEPSIGIDSGTTIISPKSSFLWSVEHIIKTVNHYDLVSANTKIQWLDYLLWISLPEDYGRVAHTVDRIKDSYQESLSFKKTAFHYQDHLPTLFPIVDNASINAKLETVRNNVDASSYVPVKYPTDSPPIPPIPWWMWLILGIIIAGLIALGIYLWLRSRP